MVNCIKLEEVVFAAIAGDFKLGAKANNSANFSSPSDGLLDVLHVAIEVHRPLVQIARSNFQKPHLLRFNSQLKLQKES